jgi:hypothetical protein
LHQALAEIQKLPALEQEPMATLILDELADERRWDEAFTRSQDQLGRLAQKVRQDIKAGRTRNARPDEL